MGKFIKIKINNELNYLEFESIRFERGKYIYIYVSTRFHKVEIKEVELYNTIIKEFEEFLNDNDKTVFDFVRFKINFNNDF